MITLTTEADFRDRLNEDPTDWFTLCGYADYLADKAVADPRIEGYAALGRLRLVPWWFSGGECWGFWLRARRRGTVAVPAIHYLPEDWFNSLEVNRHVLWSGSFWDIKHTQQSKPKNHNGFLLIRAAALAFTRLPTARQSQLLASELVEAA